MNFIQRIFEHLVKPEDRDSVIEVKGRTLIPTRRNELLGLIGQVQRSLEEHGVTKGDRVALLAPNSTRWTAVDLALLSVGAVSVPLYNRQEPRELLAMLKDCEPKLLICSETDLKADCPTITYDDIFHNGQAPCAVPNEITVGANDPVTIVYTSGTSGEAKGVVLHRSNLDFMLEQTTSSLREATGRTTNEDRVFHFLPLCFLGSRIMFLTQLFRGNPVMLSTDLKNLAEEMATASPNFFLTVPAVLDRIRRGVGEKLKEKGGFAWNVYSGAVSTSGSHVAAKLLASALVFPKIRRKIGDNLEFIISGSAALSPETHEWFLKVGLPILQVYGLTETTGIVTMDREETADPGYVGRPIDGCEIRISGDGELLCRGPNIFQGYWNNPGATAAVIKNGWLHTGDQVEVSTDGNVKIVGRVKNLLVPASGHNVAPEPIEQKIVEICRGVEHAVVVGHGKPYLAVLITGSAEDEEIARTLEVLNKVAPHYRKIRKYARLTDKFTPENGFLTANQKLKRRTIEETYQTMIDSLYAGEIAS